jgi:hypothetical protein
MHTEEISRCFIISYYSQDMRNLKVWTFHPVARNSIIFILLSLLFIILHKSLHTNLPFMNRVFLERIFWDEWYIFLAALPAMWSLLSHRPHSKYFFVLLVGVVIFRVFESLVLNFNKVIMILLFIYVCISYMLYQLIDWTFSRSIFSPNFPVDVLNQPMSHKITVGLNVADKSYQGIMTNWDESGVFVYLDEPWTFRRKQILVTVELNGHRFAASGKVVTATWDKKGIGVEWDHRSVDNYLSWNSLMELFEDYGWVPQLLR